MRFDDVLIATVPHVEKTVIPIDPRYIEVCEAGSIAVCGCAADLPVNVGATVRDNKVQIRFAEEKPAEKVQLVIRLTGIRRGFADRRFDNRTQAQFDANEKFIKMAYADDGK